MIDEEEDIDENERVEYEVFNFLNIFNCKLKYMIIFNIFQDFSTKEVDYNYFKNDRNNIFELNLNSSSSDESINDCEVLDEQLTSKILNQHNNKFTLKDKMKKIAK